MFKKLLLALSLTALLSTPALAVRQTLTAKTPTIGSGGTISANDADMTFTAADTTNHEAVVLTGREILIAYNSSTDTAYTVTVTSAPDQLGRTGHISTYSLDFGEYAVFGPFPTNGWKQTDGKLYFEGSNAAIKFAVVKVPAI